MSRGRVKILIVDDSAEDREAYRRALVADIAHEYEFLWTETARDGLALLASAAPDCVLLDYRLPDLDGLEFLDAVRDPARAPRVPVVVLTGQGSEAVAVEAMKSGAQDYLSKDACGGDVLARAVHNAIEKVHLRQRLERHGEELARANDELRLEIAQRRLAEEKLRQMADDLERLVERRTAELARANRLKDEFLATVSHELRTPLNAIMGWAEVLRQPDVASDAQGRGVEAIERNARSQLRLIDDILDVSRIVSGQLRLETAATDLAQLVESALDVVRPTAEVKGVRLDARLEGPAPAIGDADRLRQVVWNVLSNAVKFTPQDGEVSVAMAAKAGDYELRVRDTGVGISPSFLPYVFEPFRQGDATATRRHGGLGLGLAISRQLVELHGGRISVESAGLDRGSTFTIVIPRPRSLAHPTARRGAADARGPAPTMFSGFRLVVVDDDPDTRELFAMILRQYGASVVACGSAIEALEAVKQHWPDLLLSDIAMPDYDGYALVEWIRRLEESRPRRLPAIAVTAYARHLDRAQALAAGFEEHLAKPIHPRALVEVVDRVLNSQARHAGPSP